MERIVDNAIEMRCSSVFVIGASGRQTADLLKRTGIRCGVADLYGDRDTKIICGGRLHRLSRLQNLSGLIEAVKSNSGVVFAGGLESAFVEAEKVVPKEKQLFCAASGLGKLKDIYHFNEALRKADVTKYPLLARIESDTQKVVVKDVCRSGTARLQRVRREEGPMILGEGFVAQEFIVGRSISGIFVGPVNDSERLEVKFLGVSEQLLGGGQGGCFSASEFQWCGNVTGVYLSGFQREQAAQIATVFAKEFGLKGVFGIDFIVNQAGVWPVDVNPRIPASSELFGPTVIKEHLRAFDFTFDDQIPLDGFIAPEGEIRGKAVVYNRQDTSVSVADTVTKDFPFRHDSDLTVDSIADVPGPEIRIEPGHPILTVFATGSSRDAVLSRLKDMAIEVRQHIIQC